MGGALAYLSALYPAPSPLDLSNLPPWMIFVYFVLAAPVQEELIFRGLLQTVMARAVSVPGGFWAVHFPIVFVAALFGVIHLDSGIVVALRVWGWAHLRIHFLQRLWSSPGLTQ